MADRQASTPLREARQEDPMSNVRYRELSWLNQARRNAGMDRNPLRRREDRIRSAAAILLAVLMLAAVPSAAILVGSGVYHSGLRAEATERASRHQVTAQVTESSTTGNSQFRPLQVSRKLPDGTQRTAPYSGAETWDGSTRVWISRSGDLATPPRTHALTVADTVAAAAGTAVLLSITPILAFWLLRRWLDRRRDRLWDADWAATDIGEGRPPRQRPDQP
jgi:hypothetical protein